MCPESTNHETREDPAWPNACDECLRRGYPLHDACHPSAPSHTERGGGTCPDCGSSVPHHGPECSNVFHKQYKNRAEYEAALTAPGVTKNVGDDRTGEVDENSEARIFGVPYSVDPDLPPGCVRFGEKVLLIDRKNERLLEVLMAPAVPVVSDPEQVSVNREDLDRFVGFYFDGEYEGNYQFNNAGHVARAGQSLRAALDGDSR